MGQSKQIFTKRKNQHKSQMNSYDSHFNRALRKYGFENFKWSVLYENVPESFLDSMEKWVIASYNTFNEGYNKTTGGQKDFMPSRSVKKKISKNNVRYWKDKKFSEKHRQNLKENHQGMLDKNHTKESKEKMSKNNCRHWKGKKLSVSHRKKMSETTKEWWRKKKGEQ